MASPKIEVTELSLNGCFYQLPPLSKGYPKFLTQRGAMQAKNGLVCAHYLKHRNSLLYKKSMAQQLQIQAL